MRCAFISCDVIGHSSESNLEVQISRVAGINEAVRQIIARSGSTNVVWASGGDGGHVALPVLDFARDAINLILAWRQWAERENVPLRIAANLGDVEQIMGADGRTQLVGHGINLAGRLLAFSDQNRIVVTSEFRDEIVAANLSEVFFHDEREIEPRFFAPQLICLMSWPGVFQSRWDVVPFRSDEDELRSALAAENGLESIYFARRLLQVDENSEAAKSVLRLLASDGAGLLSQNNLISELLRDREYGEPLIHGMQLIERNRGDVLCKSGDDGQTMFLVLRGELGGYFSTHTAPAEDLMSQPAFIVRPGDLAGELAFSLQRKRTATLLCLKETALLCFSYSDCLKALSGTKCYSDLKDFIDRKIRSRVLEHICNASRFLIGKTPDGKSTGPLSKKSNPWVDLLPYFRIINLEFESTPEFKTSDEVFNDRAVYILLGGMVERIDPTSEILNGQDEPVIFAHGIPNINIGSARYRLLENVTIGAIGVGGLLKFGAGTYRDVVEVLGKCVVGTGNCKARTARPNLSNDRKRFDVALSYAREHRVFVEEMANALSDKLSKSRVFFDCFYEAELARPNLDTYLQKVYHADTELVVVVLCREYSEKQWCGLELRGIRDLIKQRKDDEIMFIRIGDSSVDGIFGIDGYLNAENRTAIEISEVVCDRLSFLKSRFSSE